MNVLPFKGILKTSNAPAIQELSTPDLTGAFYFTEMGRAEGLKGSVVQLYRKVLKVLEDFNKILKD